MSPGAPSAPSAGHGIPFGDAVRVWTRIGFQSFGGPAGQIAMMHRVLVDERRWISEHRFLHALNYCMLLPGPEAQQLATYIGWLLHGTRGGLVAGGLFVLPGFLAMLVLGILYAGFQQLGVVDAAFFGLKAAVLAVVVEALIRIGRRVLKNGIMMALAAAAFIGIFFFALPFPLIVLGAGLLGLVGGRLHPDLLVVIKPAEAKGPTGALDTLLDGRAPVRPSLLGTARVAFTWLAIWLLPLGAMALALGPDHVFVKMGAFFSKAAVVTFGGAYAVLAYVAHEVVEKYGWLAPGEMLDGLGLAETTPGPLILVLEFVGFLAAYRNPGALPPMLAGTIGAIVTTWATFAPCFLWIFVGAPYVEWLRGNRALSATLSAITAAVVGVVLNLAVWFSVHVLFATVHELKGPLGTTILSPEWRTLSVPSLVIAVAAMLATLRFHLGMIPTLAASAAAGIVWYAVTTP